MYWFVCTTESFFTIYFSFSDSDMTFKHVSAGAEVWAVSTDGAMHRRLGVSTDNPTGTGWQLTLNVGILHVSSRGNPF